MGDEEKEIRTNRLVLQDKQGRARIILSGDDGSGPGVTIFNENGIPRIELFIDHEGKPNIVLIDEDNACRGQVTMDDDGIKLRLIDEEQQFCSAVVVGWKGPKLVRYDPYGGRIYSQTLCEEVEDSKPV